MSPGRDEFNKATSSRGMQACSLSAAWVSKNFPGLGDGEEDSERLILHSWRVVMILHHLHLFPHASSENLHPLLQKLASPHRVPSAFSLDRPGPDALDSRSSCLEDLLEWFAQRCCSFCSRFV
ncbi:hypothetical protein OIU85_023241 [Salix viminalis]|uniref:Uncharacterized protein n=1 Tax=Salix viminalis TaxID=40686 RepID=A0A9Q0TY79_SALVM|nr:hypothetical protein OIU85_023241 [Salix viminalis]